MIPITINVSDRTVYTASLMMLGCVGIVCIAVVAACTPSQRQDVKSGIDTAKPFLDAACLIANQAMPDEEALKLCKFEGPLLDLGKSFLVTARTATDHEVSSKMARAVSRPCGTMSGDAGK